MVQEQLPLIEEVVISKPRTPEQALSARAEQGFPPTRGKESFAGSGKRQGIFFLESIKVKPRESIIIQGLRSGMFAGIIPQVKQQQPSVTQTQRQISIQQQIPIQKTKPIQETKPMQQAKLIQITSQLQEISPAQTVSPIQEVTPMQEITPLQDIIQITRQTFQRPKPPRETTITRPPEKPISKPSKALSTSSKQISREQAYDVYIKSKLEKLRKGKYRSRGYYKANQESLTKESALGLGASIVDRYANRSFAIRKAKGTPINRPELSAKARVLLSKFRAAKRNPNILVEKSAHAIDSPEEVRQIPYEALRQRSRLLSSQTTSQGKRAIPRGLFLSSRVSSSKRKKTKAMRFLI